MSVARVRLVTLRSTIGLLVTLMLAGPLLAQHRKPVALWVDTPNSDVDCPQFETALRDAFAVSPRYELVDISRVRDGAMLFSVSCLSLHDVHVMSVYYTVQAFDDPRESPSFGAQETGHELVMTKSIKEFASSILVSFDHSVTKHYQR